MAVQRVTEDARRATCRKTLRSIALACHMYADDSDMEFPPDLETLMPCYVATPRFFSCPSNPSDWRDYKEREPVTERISSYTYEGGLRADMHGMFILIYDRTMHPSGRKSGPGRNVAFADAHVEWWPAEREEEFQARLAAQREAVAAWRKSGKSIESLSEIYAKVLEGRE